MNFNICRVIFSARKKSSCFFVGILVMLVTLVFTLIFVGDESLDKGSKRYIFAGMLMKTENLRGDISRRLKSSDMRVFPMIPEDRLNGVSDYTAILDGGEIVMYDIKHKMLVILIPKLIGGGGVEWKCRGNDVDIFPSWCLEEKQ